MNIAINKDIEEEYKDEFTKGFTLRECVYIAIAILIVAGVGFLCWWKFKLAIDICVYVGFPFAFPVLLFGFKKPCGMYMGKFIKELRWEKKTRLLLYEADEEPETDEFFSMQTNGDLNSSEKKTGRREMYKR